MAAPRFLNLVSGLLKQIVAVQTGPASLPTEQVVSTNASGVVDVTLMPTPGTAPASTAKVETAGQAFARRLTGL